MKSWKNKSRSVKNGLIVAAAAFVLIIFCGNHLFAQEDMQEIDNRQFISPQKSAARFEHDRHNEIVGLEECNACHHVYDDDGNKIEDESSEDQMCADCHGLDDSGRQPGLRKAFHRNCKGCHLEQHKGPIMCGECHLK